MCPLPITTDSCERTTKYVTEGFHKTHVGTCDISCIHTSFMSSNSCFVVVSHLAVGFSLGGEIITHDVGRFVFAAAPRSTFDGT